MLLQSWWPYGLEYESIPVMADPCFQAANGYLADAIIMRMHVQVEN